jgi:hypothetical protein
MLCLEKPRQPLARDTRQNAVQRLHDAQVLTELRESRRRLEPDVTAANNDDARGAGQLTTQPVDIVTAADAMHTLKLSAGTK